MSQKQERILLFIGLATMLLGLLLFAYLGYFNRYYADDWCYNLDFKNLGLWGTLEGYVFRVHYASNRYSLTFFSGLMYPLGVFGLQMMTGLAIVSWLAGIYWIVWNLNQQFNLWKSSWMVLLLASICLYYSLYLAPHPYQNLHWRAGFMPYTAPLILGTWLFGLYAHQMRTAKAPRWQIVVVALLAFFAAGFSEAANTFLVTATFLMMLAAYWGKGRDFEWAQAVFGSTVAGFTAAFVSLIVLVSSPAIPYRMKSYSEPTPLAELPALVLKLGLDFVEYFVNDLPVPTLVILITAGCLGLLFTDAKTMPDLKKLGKWLGVVAIIAYLLISASHAPSAYIEQGPPEARGLLPARYLFIVTLMIFGWAGGAFVKSKTQNKFVLLMAVFIFGLSLAYTGRSILIVNRRTPIYQERAAIWDVRNERIITAQAQGVMEIDVRGIDSLPVGGMKDLQPNPR